MRRCHYPRPAVSKRHGGDRGDAVRVLRWLPRLGAAVAIGGALFAAVHTAGAAPSAAPPRTGQQIWQQDCAVCHAPDGTGSYRAPAVNQSGTASVDFMVRTGRMPIANPTDSANRAPPKYSSEEIDALVAYAGTFITGPTVPTVDISSGDLAAGGDAYRLNCASCHQAAGAGGALAYGVTAPPLTSATPTEVVEAMRTGPGRMPVFGPNQLSDQDATSLARYVDYLRDPNDRGGAALGHLGPVPEGLVAWVLGFGGLVVIVRWLGTRDPLGRDHH